MGGERREGEVLEEEGDDGRGRVGQRLDRVGRRLSVLEVEQGYASRRYRGQECLSVNKFRLAKRQRDRETKRERTGTTLGLAFLIVPLVTALQMSPRMRSRASPSSSHETVNRGESHRTIEDGSS